MVPPGWPSSNEHGPRHIRTCSSPWGPKASWSSFWVPETRPRATTSLFDNPHATILPVSKSWGAAWAEVSASDRKPGAPAASNDAREKRELVRPRCEAVAELEWPDWKEATSPCSQGHYQHRSRLIPGTGPDTSVWRNGAGMEGIRIMRE